MTSLPTPLSPVIRTLASPAADLRAMASTSSIAALPAMITGAVGDSALSGVRCENVDSLICCGIRYSNPVEPLLPECFCV